MDSNADPAYVARSRPPLVLWAGAVMVALGGAMAANGLALMAGSGVYLAALIVTAIGALVVAVAVGVLTRRRWARRIGILVSAVLAAVTLAGLPGASETGNIVLSVAFIAGNGFVVWVLATSAD